MRWAGRGSPKGRACIRGPRVGSGSGATRCWKGPPIYSPGTETDVGGQGWRGGEYIRWAEAPTGSLGSCAALLYLRPCTRLHPSAATSTVPTLAASERSRRGHGRRRADHGRTGPAHDGGRRQCTHVGRRARRSAGGRCGRRRRARRPWAGSRWAARRRGRGQGRVGARGAARGARWGRCASSTGDRSVHLSGKRRPPAETILPAETRAQSRPVPRSTLHRYTPSRPFRTSPSTYINVITVHELPQSAPSPPPFSPPSSRQIPQNPST